MSVFKDLTGKTIGDFYIVKRVDNTHDECGTARVNYAVICIYCARGKVTKARYLSRSTGTRCSCQKNRTIKEKEMKSPHTEAGEMIAAPMPADWKQNQAVPFDYSTGLEYPDSAIATEGEMREPLSPFRASTNPEKEQTLVEKILDLSDSRTRLQSLFNHLEEENKRLAKENELLRSSNNTLKAELLRIIMKRG